MALDEDFAKMEFFSAVEDTIPEEVISGLKFGPLTCKPRFVIFCGGEKKDEIDGADYTQLEACLKKNIPSSED